jgi:hypothetical protein
MSGKITGQVWKSLLKYGEETGHIRCTKLDSPVWKTGDSGFNRIENYEEL